MIIEMEYIFDEYSIVRFKIQQDCIVCILRILMRFLSTNREQLELRYRQEFIPRPESANLY